MGDFSVDDETVEIDQVIQHLYQNETFSDIRVIPVPGEREFRAHKLVLSLFSPVLSDRFYGKNSDKSDILYVHDVDISGVSNMMSYCYYGDPVLTNTFQVKETQKIANKYKMVGLSDECKRKISELDVDVSNVLMVLEMAVQYGNENKEKECLEIIGRNQEVVFVSKTFIKMKFVNVCGILDDLRRMGYLTEVRYLRSALRWMNCEIDAHKNKLMDKIQISKLSLDEFTDLIIEFPNFLTNNEISDAMREIKSMQKTEQILKGTPEESKNVPESERNSYSGHLENSENTTKSGCCSAGQISEEISVGILPNDQRNEISEKKTRVIISIKEVLPDNITKGSPFKIYVDPISSGFVIAHGPGLTRGKAGEPANFTIYTKESGAGGLSIAVEGPSEPEINCHDNMDGTVAVNYLPAAPGEYKITVKCPDNHIKGSPFTAKITEEGHERNQIAVGHSSEVSLKIPLKIQEKDTKNLNASIVTPSGLEEPCFLKTLPNGHLGISFTPHEASEYLLNVKRTGNHIEGSPFKINVLDREIGDSSKVEVTGDAFKEAIVTVEDESSSRGLMFEITGDMMEGLPAALSAGDHTFDNVDMSYEGLYFMLACLKNIKAEMSSVNSIEAFKAAVFFQLQKLQDFFIIKIGNIIDYDPMYLDRLRCLAFFEDKLLQVITTKPRCVILHPNFIYCSFQLIEIILEQDELRLYSELPLLLVTIQWLEARKRLRWDSRSSLLNKIAFGNISHWELLYVTKRYSNFFTDEEVKSILAYNKYETNKEKLQQNKASLPKWYNSKSRILSED